MPSPQIRRAPAPRMPFYRLVLDCVPLALTTVFAVLVCSRLAMASWDADGTVSTGNGTLASRSGNTTFVEDVLLLTYERSPVQPISPWLSVASSFM